MRKNSHIQAGFPASRSQLEEELQMAMLRLALFDDAQGEAKQLEEEFDRLPIDQRQALEPDPQANRQFLIRMSAALRQRRLRRFSSHVLLPLGRAAAALVILMSLGVTTAVASNEALRSAVMQLIFSAQHTRTEVRLVPVEEAVFPVPEGWRGKYFPAFIPEGYSIVRISRSEGDMHRVAYQNEEGNLLHFTENTINSTSNIDTEGAAVSKMLIHGYQGLLSQKNGISILTWSADDRYFVLSLAGDKNLALQIAESVTFVQ